MRIHVSVMAAAVGLLGIVSPVAAQYWSRPPLPRSGACFYRDINFRGDYFCTAVGDAEPRVPRGVNDEISSIRLFGNAEVVIYKDGNMRGDARRFTTSVRDLRYAGFNDRLTSYEVRPRGYGGNYGGAYGGGGYNGGGYGNGGYNGGYDPGPGGGYGGGYGGAYGGGSHWGSANHGNGSRWTYRQAEQMVRQAYRRVFRREPDPAARPWVDEVLKNNWSQRQLEDALRETPEGRRRPF